jgi:hypothetical protein
MWLLQKTKAKRRYNTKNTHDYEEAHSSLMLNQNGSREVSDDLR